MTVETRYFRSDEHTVNGLTAKKLLNTSDTAPSAYTGEIWADTPKVALVYFEFNIRHADGSLTYLNAFQKRYSEEIDQDVIVEVSIPLRSLQSDDAIQVEVIFDVGGTEYMHEFFITEQLNAWRLNNATWKVVYHIYYWKNYVEGHTPPWVTVARFSPKRIEDFAYDEPANFSKTISDAIGVSDIVERARVAWRKTFQERVKLSDLMNTLKTSGGAPENWLSGWQYRKKHDINGSDAGAVTNYQIKLKIYYQGKSVRGLGSPICRNDLLQYDPSTGDITKKHDLLNDSSHYSEIIAPPGSGSGYWSGGQSILKDGDVYYLTLRKRDPTNRGYQIECYSSTDLSSWTLEWSVHKSDVTGISVKSFEMTSLRKFGDTYYLYFCIWDADANVWKIYCVSDSTINGLEAKLKDSSYWVDVLPSYSDVKDPRVHEIGGEYYMVVTFKTASGAWIGQKLYKSSSPTSGFTEVARLDTLYTNVNGDPDDANTGVIIYDEQSGHFIYWANARHGSTVYWWYLKSFDLETWEYIGREVAVSGWDTSYNTARYMDYWALDDQRIILVMEWDHDGDYDNSVVLWDYSDDASGSTDTRIQNGAGDCIPLGGKCRSDFGDVRFTDDDGTTLLDYWMEKKIDGDYAIFWVKVPSIPADPDKATIYVYYGKSDAVYDGDASQVFEEFEDFEQSSTLTFTDYNIGRHEYSDLWAKTGTYSLRFIDNSTAADGATHGLKSITSGQYAVEAWIKPSWNDAVKDHEISLAITDTLWAGFRNYGAGNDPRLGIIDTSASWRGDDIPEYKSITNWTQDTVYKLIVKKNANGTLTIELRDADGALIDSFTTTNTYSLTRFGCRLKSGGGQAGDAFIDALFMRKYIDPEPTHGTWYAEEEYTLAVNYELTLAEALGASDVYSRSWSAIKPLPDQIGAYDAVTPLRGTSRLIEDYIGLLDSPSKQPASLRADSLAMFDAYVTIKSLYRYFSDAVGVYDYKFLAVEARLSDLIALYDTSSRHPTSYIGDFMGLSDRVSSYIFGKMVLADGIGLYDSFTKVFTAYRTYSEPLGVYDALATVKAQFRSFAELASLVDTVSKSTHITRDELVSLNDVIEKVFTAYREYADSVGLLDIVSKQPSRTLADHTGLYDVASKAISRRIEDSAALSDLVERHPATLIADSISLYDAYIKKLTAHKEVIDVVGLLDVLTPVKALFEVFSEPMALADAFARKWDIKREYSEGVELRDEVTRRWGKWILLTESIAAYDEEYLLRLRKAVARILSPKRILPAFREQSPDRVQGPGSE